ncbi:MAG: asparagine synthetase [Myxococcaceae bacterium]|nr:asparagine synthetase [Myxococcaceae bacterium]
MCGITGWIDFERDLGGQGEILRSMRDSLAARGPDAAGEWISRHALLGHRRLAVMDPEHGEQPMVRRRGESTFVAIYNGELYNTPEIRRELVERGHTFQTRCDTEVLLEAYLAWGPDCLARFNGIFAFAVWTEPEGLLFLARDRIGVKPLFYAQIGSAFLFGSELKALLANPLVTREVRVRDFEELFLMSPCRTPGSGVFRQIEELAPGHYLSHERSRSYKRKYWQLESRPHEDSFERTVDRVRELVTDAVTRQLVSDVPLGAMVSGGLDSSAIAAIATARFREQNRGPLPTWSLDFEGNTQHFKSSEFVPDQDHPWVEKVTRHLETEHHRILLEVPELTSALRVSTLSRDLPGAAETDASLLLFCREIKKKSTVVLSGETADEIFGGYRWFHDEQFYQQERFPWLRLSEERTQLLCPELAEQFHPEQTITEHYRQSIAQCPPLPGEEPFEAKRREMFFLNFTRWLPMMLDRKDRASMHSGLEVRVPFCDHRIVEYLWNVPWDMKNAGGIEKGLLRHAMQGMLPDDVLWRKKSPYPTTHDPAYLRAVRTLLVERLRQPSSRLQPLLNMEAVKRLLATPEADAARRHWFGMYQKDAQFLAFLCQLDMWMTEYQVSLV